MFPGQTCSQHWHPPVGDSPGKKETFRCRFGTVYLYLPGPKTEYIKGKVPEGKEAYFTIFHEVILKPVEQYTIPPNTPHWFQSGEEGAVVSEFSTESTDEFDLFTDPEIKRAPKVAE